MHKKVMEEVFKMLSDDIDETDYVKKIKPKISVKMMALKKPDDMEGEDMGLEGNMKKYFEIADDDADEMSSPGLTDGNMNEDRALDGDPFYDGDSKEEDEMLKRMREKMKAKRESMV